MAAKITFAQAKFRILRALYYQRSRKKTMKILLTLKDLASRAEVLLAHHAIGMESMFIGKESVMRPEITCLACEHFISNPTTQKLRKKLANYKHLHMSAAGFKRSTCIVH